MSAITPPRTRHRLGPVTAARHCLTLAGRNLLHLKANPGEVIGFAVLQPLLVIALLVYVFGGAISGDPGTYLQYALPGLLVQSTVTAALTAGSGLHQDIANGVFDRLRSLPVARIAPLMGHLLGNMVRVALSLVMLLVLGAAQGFDISAGFLSTTAALVLAVLFGSGLGWLSMLVGLTARSATTVHMFSGILMVPLTFCSNIFVPTDTMPGWLRWWAEVNPVSYQASALRALITGGPLTEVVWWTLGWTAALTALFAPLAVRAYRKRI
jgi:ABC transporter DrrB family efflux protein